MMLIYIILSLSVCIGVHGSTECGHNKFGKCLIEDIFIDENADRFCVDDRIDTLICRSTCRHGYIYSNGMTTKNFTCTSYGGDHIWDTRDYCLNTIYPIHEVLIDIVHTYGTFTFNCEHDYRIAVTSSLATFENNIRSICDGMNWDVTVVSTIRGGAVKELEATLNLELLTLDNSQYSPYECLTRIGNTSLSVFELPNKQLLCEGVPGSIDVSGVIVRIPTLTCADRAYYMITRLSDSTTVCVPIGAGNYYDDAEGTFKSCPDGFYQEQAGQVMCKSCPVGTYSTDDKTGCQDILGYSKDKGGFEENHPAYFLALPPASRIVRPRVNATAIWLLDGLNATQSAEFLERDGLMLIFSMSRQFDGKNGTYRIQEDNGEVHDVNLTISVYYGPSSPLTLKPDRAFYHVSRGDVLPDITCSTDCKPSCQVTWDRSGVGNILRLGQVDVSSSGMYTCRAIRNTSCVVVEKSLYIEVTDDSTFVITVAVLGSLLALCLLVIIICVVCMFTSSSPDGGCMKKFCKGRDDTSTNAVTYENEEVISTEEMGHYDVLDTSQSANREPYVNLRI